MRISIATAISLLPLFVSGQLPSITSLLHHGDILFQREFTDKGGRNVIFASHVAHEKEMRADIYVYQYVSNGGAPTLVWDIKDFGTPLCEMVVKEESVQILDLDGDGYMESSFIYQSQCDGLDPYVTKLMLHSKGTKYAIRGLISPEDGTQVEKKADAVLESGPSQLRYFAHAEWDEFVESGGTASTKSVHATGKGWTLLSLEDLLAGGAESFRLLDASGKPFKLSPEVAKGIQYAADACAMPDPSKLLYLAVDGGVGIYEPATGKLSTLMTFLGDTEALSTISWSPDRKKVAFVALNKAQYPQMTRIFVLSIDGTALTKKEKYDARVFTMAAGDWMVMPVSFLDNKTISYTTKTSEGEEGPEEKIVLE